MWTFPTFNGSNLKLLDEVYSISYLHGNLNVLHKKVGLNETYGMIIGPGRINGKALIL